MNLLQVELKSDLTLDYISHHSSTSVKYRDANLSPFGEIRRFDSKIGRLCDSCRSAIKMFLGYGGGLGPGVICGRELLCAIMTRMVFFFYIL